MTSETKMLREVKALGNGRVAVLSWLLKHRDQAAIVLDAATNFSNAATVRQRWDALKPLGDVIADDIDELSLETGIDAKRAMLEAKGADSLLARLMEHLPAIIAVIEAAIEVFTSLRDP